MQNEDALRRLLATSVEVDVEGEKLILTLPEPDLIAKVNEALMVGTEADDDVKVDATTQAIATAVQACLGNSDLTLDQAKQLVALSGGAMGELAQAAARFCGLNFFSSQVDENPTQGTS